MSKSKKVLAMFLCATMVASMCCSFTGCSKKNKNKKGEIRFMFWDNFNTSKDPMTKELGKLVDDYNKKFEGKYHITTEFTSNKDHDPKLSTCIQANNTPDVFVANPGPQLEKYAVQFGATRDLTGDLDKIGAKYTEQFMGPLKFDGKLAAVPLNYASSCVYYNKEVFEKAGVKAESIKTYEDLLDACKAIKEKKAAKSPIVVATASGSYWCLSMIAGYLCDREGIDLKKMNSGEDKWEGNENAKAAAEKLKELSEFVQPTYKEDGNDMATQAFANGEAGILVQGLWAMGQINGTAKDPEFKDKYGIMPFPTVKGKDDKTTLIAKTDNICVSKDTKEPEACIEFLKMLASDDFQKKTVEICAKMPIIDDCSADYSKAPKQLQELKVFADKAIKENKVIDFYNESMVTKPVADEFDKHMVSVFQGTEDIDTALKAIEAKNKDEQAKHNKK